jgi:hypothetical protein
MRSYRYEIVALLYLILANVVVNQWISLGFACLAAVNMAIGIYHTWREGGIK